MRELTNHDSPTWLQHSIHFTECDLGIADVAKTKTDGDRIETGRGKRQRFRVSHDEFNIRMAFAPLCHHSGREIQRHDLGTSPRKGFRRGSRSGSNIEHPFTGLNFQCFNRGNPPEHGIPTREQGVSAVIALGDLVKHSRDFLWILVQVCGGHVFQPSQGRPPKS